MHLVQTNSVLSTTMAAAFMLGGKTYIAIKVVTSSVVCFSFNVPYKSSATSLDSRLINASDGKEGWQVGV